MNNKIFISHSTKDDDFVKGLRKRLEMQGIDSWVDSRQLSAGNDLEPSIARAIQEAHAFMVVFSPAAFNSPWILKEVKLALDMKKKKGDAYPMIPLMLEGVEPAALNLYFDKEPMGIKIKTDPGGVNEAMPQVLAALGLRLPEDHQPMHSLELEPLDELLLELTDPCIVEKDGVRRAQAKARLVYHPGEAEKPEVASRGRFLFTSPIGLIESEDLHWYLERYFIWPAGLFRDRAQGIEKKLPEWGQALYNAVMNDDSAREVFSAWEGAKLNRSKAAKVARRFTVFVDWQLVNETEKEKQVEASEAATMLLGLPWELLHDGRGYLFQGAKPVRIRRRLPNTKSFEPVVSEPPIRILLVSPRPEDERAGYIDHRVSALPLVSALESLGELAELKVLAPPTFQALEEELLRAQEEGKPYHAVHFDGHGVFDKVVGLGGLCFEDPGDADKLEQRKSQIIHALDIAAVIRDHRIPLFFLEACQSAKAEESPTASVAAALLDEGTASVVAMSHSVLVETARRFVKAFYYKLAEGARVGEAMLAGQRELKADRFRLRIFGAGRLELDDWFVPVLYQEKEDLRLLTRVPSGAVKEIDRNLLEARFSELLKTPEHDFIGRSRELLKLERLLGQKKFAVICGQGGEGKTTLAVELARWLIRTKRFERAVFVSMEDIYDVRTVVDLIGRQLVSGYTVAEYSVEELLTKALLPIERRLREEHTLIILDNMESILPPVSLSKSFFGGFKGGDFLEKSPLLRFTPEMLKQFFDLCGKLLKVGGTRILFTSREAMLEPFDVGFQRVMLGRLEKADAIQLVHQAMTVAGLTPKEDESGGTQVEVEALVESVNCHARSLVLLAPFISQFGVGQTTKNLSRLMADLDKRHPDERERSLYACVELSLRRLSPGIREKIKPLGVFQGGAHLYTLTKVLELPDAEGELLVQELLQTGLTELKPYGFLRFHPGLCPYLWQEMGEAERETSVIRWAEGMGQLNDFLYGQLSKDAQLARNLTTFELPNLVCLLDYTQEFGDSEKTVALVTKLEQLIAPLGRRSLLAQIVAIREKEAKKLPGWSHTRFESLRMQIDRLLESGNVSKALQEAQALLDKSLHYGEDAYVEADYDMAMAYVLKGRTLIMGGTAEAALQPIDEAFQRFQNLAEKGSESAARMASAALTEKGNCLIPLGRLDEAVEAYEAGIQIAEKIKDFRGTAVKKNQLGTVRMFQEHYKDALAAYDEAMKTFEELGEPESVATIWHQIGIVHQETGQWEAAEQAYRQSLAISIKQNNPAVEANSLGQLGNLYDKMGRLEEAVIFYRQATDKCVEINNMAKEGLARGSLARVLIKLKHYDDARREIVRAIKCDKPCGHDSQPWTIWDIFCDLERAVGNNDAADHARDKSIQLYLAYRRDGGENHEGDGPLCKWFAKAMQENRSKEIESQLIELANNPDVPDFRKVLISKLQAILAGSRDAGQADDPDLHYTDAAEILFLLEKLK